MSSPVSVKICGLSTPDSLAAALDAGADEVGFVFFPPSPRHLALPAAAELARQVEGRARIVALTVDAEEAEIARIIEAVRPDVLQLHGRETLEGAYRLRSRFGRPVMKALGISERGDLSRATEWREAADRLLYDAKPPRQAVLPGGNGQAFDWSLLAGHAAPLPWMLSGGLSPANVGAALAATGARAVDVSSGVESAPGVKDEELIRAFVAAVRQASALPGSDRTRVLGSGPRSA